MNDAKTIWERYVSTWNLEDFTERRAIFEQCLAPDCRYTDPLASCLGYAELEQYMCAFQQQLPGARFVTRYFLAHHGRSIARWQMLQGDAVIGEGISYGEYDAQQRLSAMTGFFETPGAQTAA